MPISTCIHACINVCVCACPFGEKISRLLSMNLSDVASNSPKAKIGRSDLKCLAYAILK